MDEPQNPYAPPKHDPPGPPSRLDATAGLDQIRQEHINAENDIKGLGILLYLATASLAITGLNLLTTIGVPGLINVILAIGLGLSAYLLRRLDPRGRLIYTGVMALGVVLALFNSSQGIEPMAMALGRLFWPFLFLAALWTRKASTVLTPHYREVVVPATPHIKAKTSPVLIVFLVLLTVAIVVVVAVAATR